MDLSQIPLFKALTGRLGFLDQRQRVLAENIANVDTPGYQPKDLKAPNFLRLAQAALGRINAATTNPNHIETARRGGTFQAEKQKATFETTVSGNAVDLDEQLINVSQTTLDHQTMVDLYAKQVSLLKTALDRSGG